MASGRDQAQQLIERHQSLVRSLAVNIHRKLSVHASITLEDLIAYGQVGLAEAARDFDPGRGSQFSTFAYYRIRGAIYDGLSKMTWLSRAQYHRVRCEQLSDATLQVEAEGGDPPQPPDPESQMRTFRNVTRALAVVYLSTQRDPDEEAAGIRLPNAQPEVPEVAIRHEISEKLHRLIDGLPAKAGALIRATYFEGQTLQEAGHRLGLSKSWASRLHARALQELARALRLQGVGAA
ncbi:MAG: sigma-70 family RNA polymerase sigma factor [Planctomycetes bacterium]|nr:sigma-70 family RNA polymerase sigma factor [Planctomycetota bacterium]